MPKNIVEKKSRLKYFYLIDVDKIVQDIKESTTYRDYVSQKESNTEPLFQLIFSRIIYASKMYSEYILADFNTVSPYPFFNENIYDKDIKSLRILCDITLYHHCIVRGFQNSLDTTECIKLNSKNHNKIKRGYFCPRTANSWDEFQETTQTYNSKYRRFRKNPDYYSYKLLVNISRKTPNDYLFIPKVKSNPALFLFDEPNVKTFDRHLSKRNGNPKEFLKAYEKLQLYSCEWRDSLKTLDRVLFDVSIESVYNFSFFSYFSQLLDQIYDQDSTIISELRGEGFIHIVEEYISSLPITYNRATILKYVCKIFSATNPLTVTYPPTPEQSFGAIAPIASQSEDIHSANGLLFLGRFFRILHFITLPIIEDLWDILTDSCVLGINLDGACYSSYIKAHYDFMAYDYTKLPLDAIEQPDKAKIESLFDSYDRIEQYVKKDEEKANTFFPIPFPEGRKDMTHVIQKYCTLNSSETDALFTDDLCTPSWTLAPSDERYLQLDSFQKKHLMNIINYVSGIKKTGLNIKKFL